MIEVTPQADYLSSLILHAAIDMQENRHACMIFKSVVLYLSGIQLAFSFLKQVYTRLESIGLSLKYEYVEIA